MQGEDFSHLYTPRDRLNPHRKRQKRASSLKRSNSHHDVAGPLSPRSEPVVELSVDNRAPGLLKIFGELVVAGAQYKSVLASTRSTAQELIKQALERYGLPPRLYRDFVLCESIGTLVTSKTCDEGDNNHCTPEPDSLTFKGHATNQQRSAKNNKRSTFHRFKSKLVDDRSPCGTPRRTGEDSPRTPLGSPRTPCGSPSTVRDSPRVKPVETDQECLWRRDSNYDTRFHNERLSPRQQRVNSKSYNEFSDLQKIDRRLLNGAPRCFNNSDFQTCEDNIIIRRRDTNGGANCDSNAEGCYWKPIYVRVLIPSDRPLELQEFWKPPDGFSRRYELRRRCDVIMEIVDNETLGLNDNARKIMISKVYPGVIPYSSQQREAFDSSTILKDEWTKASGTTRTSMASTAAPSSHRNYHTSTATNVVEGDPRQAYVCPSIYPYLLTLRGSSIQKDLVLYPLKSLSLVIGSGEKKLNSDDIRLSSDDISSSHCRVTLKRLPQFDHVVSEDKRQYWYGLELDILSSSFVTVNGIQVKQRATVYPGDLLGIGRQYLFLYKDPTGGHDIPSAVPWLPDQETQSSILGHMNNNNINNSISINNHNNNNHNILDTNHANSVGNAMDRTRVDGPITQTYPLPPTAIRSRTAGEDVPNLRLYRELVENLDELGDNDEDANNCLDDSSSRNPPIFLAYHKDKELELLECIADVKCHTSHNYPFALALLFLASHQYAVRKFPGNHQVTFFKRLGRVVRARVGVSFHKSKLL